MEKRFSVKDFFLFLLVIALIVSVWVAMKQYDRQYRVLVQIDERLQSQTTELTQLRRAVHTGGFRAAGPTTTTATSAGSEPVFRDIRAAQQKPDYATGDWYVDSFPVKVGVLTAHVSKDLYSQYVGGRVCEWLVTYDPQTLDLVGLLAESWTVSEDGLTITFKLRQGITFSDGAPFTADDVVFTFNWIMNPKVAAPHVRSTLDKVKDCVKVGDHEVAFHMKEPYFDAVVAVGTLDILPKHFVSKFTEEQYNTNPGILMGTGPYRMKDPSSWKPGELIEVVRNERYWGEPGPWDKIVWYEVASETAAETMFKNRQIDAFATSPEQFSVLSKDDQLLKWARALKFQSPNSGYNYVAWNQRTKGGSPSHFADKRVRQAMTMLVDRQRFLDEVWYGLGAVAAGPFSPLSGQLDPSIKPLPYDIDRAKALLKEAGYQDRDGDGVLESAQGVPFRFSLSYSSGGALGERIALFLKDSYAKVGIVMTPDPADWPIMMKKIQERDYESIAMAWSNNIESDPFQIFHSSQIADQGDNFMSYVSPEADKLIEQARTTLDKAKRMKLWHQLHRVIHEDQPYMFMVERFNLGFQDARVQNVSTSKLGLNYNQRYSMPNPWYVPKANQRWK